MSLPFSGFVRSPFQRHAPAHGVSLPGCFALPLDVTFLLGAGSPRPSAALGGASAQGGSAPGHFQSQFGIEEMGIRREAVKKLQLNTFPLV